jgi:hypothetical protein
MVGWMIFIALNEYSIVRIDQFDFENLGSENLFNTKPLDEVQKYPRPPFFTGFTGSLPRVQARKSWQRELVCV